MSFRLRLIVVSALAVAAAVALASGTAYVVVDNQLYREFDRSLSDRAAQATAIPHISGGVLNTRCFLNVTPGLVARLGGGYYQKIDSGGQVVRLIKGSTLLPITAQEKKVAMGKAGPFIYTTTVQGKRVRIYTSPIDAKHPDCGALQVGRRLAPLDQTLRRLAVELFVLGLGGIGLAAILGWVVAGTALGPVRHLTEATEHVTRTRDLSRRIEARGRDELARLANSFNTMLEALDFSVRAQRQLVADASHELRTPLTTAKTNVEVLRRAELPKKERDAILHDVSEQIDELAVLVTDIVDLARGVEPNLEIEDVRLDLLVEETVERVRRLYPENTFETELEPCLVRGVPSRLERAVSNLLDNACKWGPRGAPIEVGVKGGSVTVRDHGAGIDPIDLPFIFDRFYRADAARALPGSGLGLAIVRQIAESHGGRVTVEQPEEGGTLLRITLPCLSEH